MERNPEKAASSRLEAVDPSIRAKLNFEGCVKMLKLDGKVAVITGGSSGIGLATAQRFVAEGAYVYIAGRRQTALDNAKRKIGKNVATVQGDVTKSADLKVLSETIAKERGVVDVIVTSAGMVEVAPIELATEEHFDKTFNLNARGVFFTVQKLLPLMNRGGSIVLVSSSVHQMGVAGHSTYAATKAAIRSFARTWAAELKERGIRVNTVSPGPIETPMMDGLTATKELGKALRALFISMTPLGRIGLPEEIASAVLFLASSESSFSTGTDLIADGGITQV
jgi:NAD(P)-dependent dehydrogenase (short-subunit alcohol dehydrogenase family)